MDPLSKAMPGAANAAALTTSYHDFGGLGKLKGQARADAKAATQETAQQFEALFLQMMLKSMRDATIKSENNESSGRETFEAMFDKEISIAIAKRNSLGLTKWLVQHLPDPAAQNTSEMLQSRPNTALALHPAPAVAPAHRLQPAAPTAQPLPRGGTAMPLKGMSHE